jgi:hypothetical protein
MERFGLSIGLSPADLRSGLRGIEDRNVKVSNLASKMVSAMVDLYKAEGDRIASLIEQYGTFKVEPTGEFLFPSQAMVDRQNALDEAVAAAGNRVAQLEEERQQLIQLEEEGWHRFIDRQAATVSRSAAMRVGKSGH